MFVMCVLEGEYFVTLNVVVCAIWTVEIGMDRSVLEHLTSNAGFLGLILGPAICFHLYHLYLFV